MRDIPQAAVDFIKREEELVLRVYDDAQPTVTLRPSVRVIGKLTAGYGHTGGLSVGQTVTETDADNWLVNDDLATARRRLYGAVGEEAIDVLTDNQYAALLSFVFNLGSQPTWTIWKRVRDKQFDQVPLEMMKFVNARQHGVLVKERGLVNRRTAEVVLWSTDEPGSKAEMPPSSVTRVSDTPPTSADPTPPSKSKGMIAAVAATVAGAPPAINSVVQAVTPYAEHSDYVKTMLAGLATMAALAAGATAVFIYLHQRKAAS